MFSENNKISGRQLGRMIFVETAGTFSFLALNTIGKYGSDGLLLILWMYLFALIYTMGVFKLAEKAKANESKRVYKIISVIAKMFLIAKFLCMSAVVFNGIADVARLILIPGVSSVFILSITFICILYCVTGGIEDRGRACELLFYFVLAPIIIICFTLFPKVEAKNMLPEFNMNLKSAAMDFLLLVCFFVPAETLYLSKDSYDNTEAVRGNVYVGISLSALTNIVIYALALGVYGDNTVRKMEKPILRLMQVGGVPGDFMNRQEGIMSVFLIISLFTAGWALIYYLNKLIKSLFMQNRRVKSVLKVTSAAVVLVLAIFFISMGKQEERIEAVDIGGMDLEEREFVVSIIVSKKEEGLNFSYEMFSGKNFFAQVTADSLTEADEKLGFIEGIHIDYSHMKTIILDLQVFEDTETVSKLVDEMSRNLKFAENIVLCAIDLKGNMDSETEYGKRVEEITKNYEMFKEAEVFRFDKLYSLNKGSVTIPFIDMEAKLCGRGVATPGKTYFEYGE